MKIAIISDTHDYLPHIDLMLLYCQQNSIDRIIHCGDICKASTLDYMVQRWDKPFDFVFGNGDLVRADMEECARFFSHVTCHGEEGYLNISVEGRLDIKNKQGKEGSKSSVRIAFTHYPQVAQELAYNNKHLDFVFYGHTHKPWLGEKNNIMIANPGPLTGMIYDTSFAVLNISTKNLELILLKNIKMKKES